MKKTLLIAGFLAILSLFFPSSVYATDYTDWAISCNVHSTGRTCADPYGLTIPAGSWLLQSNDGYYNSRIVIEPHNAPTDATSAQVCITLSQYESQEPPSFFMGTTDQASDIMGLTQAINGENCWSIDPQYLAGNIYLNAGGNDYSGDNLLQSTMTAYAVTVTTSGSTPTTKPTPADNPVSTCPRYYEEYKTGGLTYCRQYFTDVTFTANDPIAGSCVTYTGASINSSSAITCGQYTIKSGGYYYQGFAGFNYQKQTNNWVQAVYPSEISKLVYIFNITGGYNGNCRPYYVSNTGTFTRAGVDLDGGTGLGAYGRMWSLDQDLWRSIQPVGIAVSCDGADHQVLNYNYGNDKTFNRPDVFATVILEYPAYATLLDDNNWMASQSATLNSNPSSTLDLSSCGANPICAVEKGGQWVIDWIKAKINDLVEAWLGGIKILFIPTASLDKLSELQAVVYTKSPWAYLQALSTMDMTNPSTATDTAIPDITIPAINIKIHDGATLTMLPETTLLGSTFDELLPAAEAIRTGVGIFIIASWALGMALLIMEGVK